MHLLSLRRGLTCALIILALSVLTPVDGIAVFKDGLNSTPRTVKENELIVRFYSLPSGTVSVNGTQSTSINSLFARYGVVEVIPAAKTRDMMTTGAGASTSNVYKLVLSGANSCSISDIAEEFSRDPAVVYAEPNYLFRVCRTPNDPYYKKQWGLAKIGASGGWDAIFGDPDRIIAVIDTGIDFSHYDLQSNIWNNIDEIPDNGLDDDGNGYVDDHRGWDFVSVHPDWVEDGEDPGPEDNFPSDFAGHGTHVSGIAAGRANNSLGTAGMTWDCKVMPLRAGYAASDGYGYLEYFDAGRAIIYAADNGADVVNMSWGGLENSSYIQDSIEYAYSKGCVLVASAGNVISEYATDPYYPAYYPEVLAVSATDEDDMLSIWNFLVFSNFGSWVDVCAPGTYVLSTIPGGSWGYYSGTSMSAPFVAGLAVLIKSRYPHLDNDQVMRRIKETADPIDHLNPDFLHGQLGSGRINAHRALGRVMTSISYPGNGAVVCSKMIIKGMASVEDFYSYRMDYGMGSSPHYWYPIIGERFEPVEGGNLAVWDATGLQGEYTIRLTVTDVSGESYVSSSRVVLSSSADVEIIGDALPFPNPFDPGASMSSMIRYELGHVPPEGVNVEIRVYDLTGTLLFREKNYSSGPGFDEIHWDGTDSFGRVVGNGVYPFYLVADKKVIGRNKIAVIR